MKRIFLLLICMVLCLSGCSVIGGNNITALMSPPQGSAQYQSVVNKLEQYLSEKNSKYVQNIVYQHPNKGSYRSAIFLCNLNGDEYEDAVIFYRLKNVSNGSNVLFLLGDGENNWSISGAFSVTYREVDNVRLGHIADASRDTVVITWKTYNTLVSDVYEWNGRNIDCLLQEKETTELGISDFDDDGLDEMIVLYQNPYGKKSSAEYYEVQGGRFFMKNKISFSSDIISYETVYTGTFGGDVKGMLLDGHLDNYTMQTNVLFVKNEYLYLLDSAKEKLRHSFKVTLRDVDGDSIPEIPSDECTTDAVWYESWFTFDAAKGLQKKATTVETYKQSYYLEVPETWKKSYGLQLSNDGLQMSVFWEKYRDDRKDTEQGINLEKSNLFQIIEENEQKLRGSGIFLSSDNGLAYWGILYDQSLFSTEELKKAFHLIKSEA